MILQTAWLSVFLLSVCFNRIVIKRVLLQFKKQAGFTGYACVTHNRDKPRYHEPLDIKRCPSAPDRTWFYCVKHFVLQHDREQMYMLQISIPGKCNMGCRLFVVWHEIQPWGEILHFLLQGSMSTAVMSASIWDHEVISWHHSAVDLNAHWECSTDKDVLDNVLQGCFPPRCCSCLSSAARQKGLLAKWQNRSFVAAFQNKPYDCCEIKINMNVMSSLDFDRTIHSHLLRCSVVLKTANLQKLRRLVHTNWQLEIRGEKITCNQTHYDSDSWT